MSRPEESQRYPRDLAVRVLTRVLSDHQPLDEVLLELGEGLSPVSRSWLQEVTSGTLRWKGRLDLVLDSIALKKKPSGWLRKVLLIGAYQLVAQDRAQPGAVVSETVTEIKRKEGEAPAKFANACLRKIADHAASWRAMKLRPKAPLAEAAAWASFPEWLWKKLVKQYGEEWAVAYAMASLDRPTLWIRTRDPNWKAEWAVPGPIPGSWKVTEGGSIVDKPGFAEGAFFVQDISSQTLIHEITETVRKTLGRSENLLALDVCAAPGGKSVGMAWNGFQVTSSDREAPRMALLQQTVNRVAPSVKVIQPADVGALEPQDLVWVDAPCTGTGIIRRHPDVRWLRREADLVGLLRSQHEILKGAWERVRPGGFLAYSVCSVLQDEGKEALLRMQLDSHLVWERLLVPQEAPHGDGFWAALLRKPGSGA